MSAQLEGFGSGKGFSPSFVVPLPPCLRLHYIFIKNSGQEAKKCLTFSNRHDRIRCKYLRIIRPSIVSIIIFPEDATRICRNFFAHRSPNAVVVFRSFLFCRSLLLNFNEAQINIAFIFRAPIPPFFLTSVSELYLTRQHLVVCYAIHPYSHISNPHMCLCINPHVA